MTLLCLCELRRAEHGNIEQPGHQGGGHEGAAASSTFLDCILVCLCNCHSIPDRLCNLYTGCVIYKENKLLAVAEEFLTVLQAGRCWHSGTTFLLLSAQGGRAGSQRWGKREKGQARPGLAHSQSVHSTTTPLK